MTQKLAGQKTWVKLCLLGGAFLGLEMGGRQVIAQIIPDNTLGDETSTLTPNAIINGGATRGSNLFHSFSEFNIGNGQSVYFANPDGIANILTRVTGINPSNILGTLGVNGTANLFLLNPNGIFFGPNAQLDIRGSFVATTADSILFDNGFAFSATNPQAPPLLTVSVPLGLQYGTNNTRVITNRGNLAVGENLTLNAGTLDLQGQLWAGGDLTLVGAGSDDNSGGQNPSSSGIVRIRDSETNPFIAASGGKLVVQGNQTLDIFALNHPDSGFFSGGDMVLRSANAVGGDAHYWSGGSFRIEQLDGSLGDLYSPYDPIIRASGDVAFNFYQGASLHILAGGNVTANTIVITSADVVADTINPTSTPNLANFNLSDGTPMQIDGNARPTLDIRAGTNAFGTPGIVETTPPSGIIFPGVPNLAQPATGGNIIVANIGVTAPDGVVFLTNQYAPNTFLNNGDILVGQVNTVGTTGNGGEVTIDSRNDIGIFNAIYTSSLSNFGNGGNIRLIADNSIFVLDNTDIFASSNGGTTGNITLNSSNLFLTNNASVSTRTDGTGQGGNITVNASEKVEISGLGSGFYVNSTSAGNAGNLTLNTSQLTLRDGAIISGDLIGSGKGGNLYLNASDFIDIAGNRTLLSVGSNGSGDAGSLVTNTRNFTLRDGAKISGDTGGLGQGGRIVINASNSVDMRDAGTSTSINNARGAGGSITVNTRFFRLRDNADLSSRTFFDGGLGGDITINASESVDMNDSVVNLQTASASDAGVFTINSKQLNMQRAWILADTVSTGQGARLLINTSEAVDLRDSIIILIANSSGNAGSITINSDSLTLYNADISSTTNGVGQGADVTLNASESINLIGGSRFTPSGLSVSTQGAGNAGTTLIDTKYFSIQNGAAILASANVDGSTGRAGDILINASESVEIIGSVRSQPNTSSSSLLSEAGGTSNAGNITIDTKNLILRDGGTISVQTSGEGRAGILEVNASESVQLFSPNTSRPSVLNIRTTGTGDAGELRINTGQLLIQDGASVFAGTSSSGRAGLLTVNAQDSTIVRGYSRDGQFASRLLFDSSGAGNAGELKINTGQLLIEDGGLVSATTSDSGRGGLLEVNASDFVRVTGNANNGQFVSSLLFDSSGTGDAGELRINTGQLLIEDGGLVSAGTSGTGQGGFLEVNASDSVRVSGASSRLFFDSTGAGDARGIRVNTGDLQVENGGEITVSGTGTGLAGDLEIAADSIFLNEQGNLLTRTVSGEGGNIRLQVAENVKLRYNSNILTEALGSGNGGDINIDAGGFVLAVLPENSDVAATAIQGRGGNIFVTARGIFGFSFPERLVRTPESDISAGSQLGIDGTTTINIGDFQQVVELPDQPGTPNLSQGCSGNRVGNDGEFARAEFYNTGRGGLPPNPRNGLVNNTVQAPWLELESTTTEVVEATGWVRLPDGRIFLTAQNPLQGGYLTACQISDFPRSHPHHKIVR